ncbi:hypothetical protein ACLK1T_01815 [Escherichia coli]
MATNYCVTPTSAVSISTKPSTFCRELHTSGQQLAAEQYKTLDLARELAEHNGAEGDWKRITRRRAIT